MIRLCQSRGIETVNIVRKPEHVKDLKENLHAKWVLNQEDPDFLTQLEAVIREVAPKIFFECIGGDLPAEIFNRMPQ